jgi:hypothetical protein
MEHHMGIGTSTQMIRRCQSKHLQRFSRTTQCITTNTERLSNTKEAI